MSTGSLADNKVFFAFVAAQLVLLAVGTSVVGGIADEATAKGKKNREAERYIQDEALDADSVRERQQLVQRLGRRLEELERIFEYKLDQDANDPATLVGADPNRFQDAVRATREELKRTGLRFPDALGFPIEVPTSELLRLRVWQLDMVRYVLRAAQRAGVEEVPDGGIRLPKKQLVDPKNFLEYAQVELTLHGSPAALAKMLHAMLKAGKYFGVEDVALTKGGEKKREGGDKPGDRPTLTLRVSTQVFNLDQELVRTDPDSGQAGTGSTSRFYEFGRR